LNKTYFNYTGRDFHWNNSRLFPDLGWHIGLTEHPLLGFTDVYQDVLDCAVNDLHRILLIDDTESSLFQFCALDILAGIIFQVMKWII
jgi:hypothetical protein